MEGCRETRAYGKTFKCTVLCRVQRLKIQRPDIRLPLVRGGAWLALGLGLGPCLGSAHLVRGESRRLSGTPDRTMGDGRTLLESRCTHETLSKSFRYHATCQAHENQQE